MKSGLKIGLVHELVYSVPKTKIVPNLYPECPEFQVMPKVFATGFLVGLIEWACIQAVNPFIDWPIEQTVGTGINVNHLAATPPDIDVYVRVEVAKVEGRRITFTVKVRDEFDLISEGSHERFIINAEKFGAKASQKIRSKK